MHNLSVLIVFFGIGYALAQILKGFEMLNESLEREAKFRRYMEREGFSKEQIRKYFKEIV